MIENAPIDVTNYGAKGDGTTDDTAAFNAAVTASVATGVPVQLSGGTYIVTTLSLTNNATFVGTGTIKKKAGTTGHLITTTANLKISGNITLDQNAANCPNPSATYNSDCTINHTGNSIVLEGITCLESVSSNLNLVTNQQIILRDCNVTGGWICVRAVPAVGCKVQILGGIYASSTVYDNIQVYNSTDVVIDGVTSTDSNLSGIVITGPNDSSTPVLHARIVNNYCYSNTTVGIIASISTSEFIIANNVCWDNPTAGIQADVATYLVPSTSDARAVISNNVIRGSSSYSISGLIVNGAQHLTVSGNFIRRAKQLMLFSNTPKDVNISGNTLEDCNDGYFINLQYPSEVNITGNTFYNCIAGAGNQGAFIFTSGSGVSVLSNHITGITGNRNLFRPTNCTNYSIIGNNISKSDSGSGYVFFIQGTCTNGYIANNKIDCSTTSFQYYIYADGATVTGTTTRDNEIVCSGIQTSPNRYIYNGSTIVADSDVINGVKNYFSVAPTMFTPMQGATAGIAGALKMWNGAAWV